MNLMLVDDEQIVIDSICMMMDLKELPQNNITI